MKRIKNRPALTMLVPGIFISISTVMTIATVVPDVFINKPIHHQKNSFMKEQSFTTSFEVDQSAQQVFEAINNVRGWWSEQIEGSTNELNSEFRYHYKDIHICRMKITEMIPGEKVVWKVLDNYFNFTKSKTEWKDTEVIFRITEKNGKTVLTFTHAGLTPDDECYNVCFDAWTGYINKSLKNLITTGTGNPTQKDTSEFNEEIQKKWKTGN
jgi:hypothetical protein